MSSMALLLGAYKPQPKVTLVEPIVIENLDAKYRYFVYFQFYAENQISQTYAIVDLSKKLETKEDFKFLENLLKEKKPEMTIVIICNYELTQIVSN